LLLLNTSSISKVAVNIADYILTRRKACIYVMARSATEQPHPTSLDRGFFYWNLRGR